MSHGSKTGMRSGESPRKDHQLSAERSKGSNRKTEHKLRDHIRDGVAQIRQNLIDYAELLRSEQDLIRQIQRNPKRAKELAKAGIEAPSGTAQVLPEMHAILSRSLVDMEELAKAIDRFDVLDGEPRMLPVVAPDAAVTKDGIVNMVDAREMRILSRAIGHYGMSKEDYLRLFGLPDDYRLWTDSFRDKRSVVMKTKKVWTARGINRRKGKADDTSR